MTGELLKRPPVRQAIQVGLAVGAATAAGSLISDQRWYWAVIAAFIVGIGVGTRHEAALKAVQRVAGTIVGVVIGIFIGAAAAGHREIVYALVLVCVFLGFYAFQQAYAVMTFCITVMLALLYGLLGALKPELLVLRLEETAAGAVIALLSTVAVLPLRQDRALREAVGGYLAALKPALGPADADERHNAIAELQRKTQALRYSVAGIKRGWFRLIPAEHRHAVRAGMRLTYLAREATAGDLTDRHRNVLIDGVESIEARIRDGVSCRENIRSPDMPHGPEEQLFAALLDAIARFDACLAGALPRARR